MKTKIILSLMMCGLFLTSGLKANETNSSYYDSKWYMGYSWGGVTNPSPQLGMKFYINDFIIDTGLGFRYHNWEQGFGKSSTPTISASASYHIKKNDLPLFYLGLGGKFEAYIFHNKHIKNDLSFSPMGALGKEVNIGNGQIAFFEINYIPWFLTKDSNHQVHMFETKAGWGF